MHAVARATTTAGGDLGLVVLMLILGTGIGLSIRHKKTTFMEFGVIGLFGLCLGATAVGTWVGTAVSSGMGALLRALQ